MLWLWFALLATGIVLLGFRAEADHRGLVLIRKRFTVAVWSVAFLVGILTPYAVNTLN